MDDDIRRCQVQARTSGTQRNQKDTCLTVIKAAHQLGAYRLWRRALQGKMTDIFLLQSFCQYVQHGCKLAEQQNAMTALDSRADKLHTGVQLCAAAIPLFCHQRRVAADLTQAHQYRKHRHFVLRLCGTQPLACVNDGRQIKLALLLLHLNTVDIFGFWRQLLQHVRFHPTQDKRLRKLVEPTNRIFVVLLYNRFLKPLAKGFVIRQISRHQERKNAPQLRQTVFHRGSCQRKTHLALDTANRLIFLRCVVFDRLRLVQNAGIKILLLVQFFVTAQQVIAGDHKVCLRPLLCQLGTASRRAVYRNTMQLRREFFAFLLPVQHKRRRTHDQAWQVLPGLFHCQKVA